MRIFCTLLTALLCGIVIGGCSRNVTAGSFFSDVLDVPGDYPAFLESFSETSFPDERIQPSVEDVKGEEMLREETQALPAPDVEVPVELKGAAPEPDKKLPVGPKGEARPKPNAEPVAEPDPLSLGDSPKGPAAHDARQLPQPSDAEKPAASPGGPTENPLKQPEAASPIFPPAPQPPQDSGPDQPPVPGGKALV